MMPRRLLCSLAAAALAAGPAATAWPQQGADLIYAGGDIVTVNDAQPVAEAVAVTAGKIVAVGSRDEIMKHRGASTRMVNLNGKTMVPGFIDAHGHAFLVGFQAVSANLLPPPDGKTSSITALQRILREYAAGPVAKRYGIVIGFGYNDAQLQDANGLRRHPTRQELDAVSKELPVIVIHQSGHLAAANSKALEVAGIQLDTPNPKGGVIRREADGKTPNGVLEETAWFGLLQALPRLSGVEMQSMALAGLQLYSRYGYTTAQEGRATAAQQDTWMALSEAGKLKLDVVSYPDFTLTDSPPGLDGPFAGRDYRRHFRIGGVKLSLDGSPQGKTAWLSRPYFRPPAGAPRNYRGYSTLTDEEAAERIDKAYAMGWQLLVHTNGDAASDQMISAMRDAVAKHGARDHRSVMIHAQTVREDQLDSMRELGILPSFFGMHTFYWGDWHREETLGPVRAERISPAMSALRRGMRFTQHHDAPVAFPDSIRILSAAITRRSRSGDILGADQRIPVDVALKSITLWAAYQHFEEDSKGSIEAGKLADFVVLSNNPLKVDPEKLSTLKVIETIKEGRTIYRAPATKRPAPEQGERRRRPSGSPSNSPAE
jgi:predicted amidohydrolase YtcJ